MFEINDNEFKRSFLMQLLQNYSVSQKRLPFEVKTENCFQK